MAEEALDRRVGRPAEGSCRTPGGSRGAAIPPRRGACRHRQDEASPGMPFARRTTLCHSHQTGHAARSAVEAGGSSPTLRASAARHHGSVEASGSKCAARESLLRDCGRRRSSRASDVSVFAGAVFRPERVPDRHRAIEEPVGPPSETVLGPKRGIGAEAFDASGIARLFEEAWRILRLDGFDRDDFRRKVIHAARGNPGQILAMCRLAGQSEYRDGGHIRFAPLRIDVLPGFVP